MDLRTLFGQCFGGYLRPPSISRKNNTDLVGKIVIVTGGNRGIGFSMVQQFARRGAKVYLAARNKERALEAIARLQSEGLAPGNGEVRWLELELALPIKVQQSAEVFLKEEKRLDILVNSACRIDGPYVIGYGGIEESMLVNHIGPFIFTKALLPLMAETARSPGADIRIIVMTSIAMSILKDHEKLHRRQVSWGATERQHDEIRHTTAPKLEPAAQSKLVNFLYAKQLQKTLDAVWHVPITVMAVHPGYVWTEGFADAPVHKLRVVGPLFRTFFKLTFLDIAEGTVTPMWAATSSVIAERREECKGAYVMPFGRVGPTPPHPQAECAELAKELWDRHYPELGVPVALRGVRTGTTGSHGTPSRLGVERLFYRIFRDIVYTFVRDMN
ncbi:hypothetical protein GSI_12032 [Ganoderma sinense ZZ0214-1]|uniref:Uncharacterized protein n=1 Tax=Ganoderma sinense ZZ0214-1 TaxID=1077348 RepID=A0A2G8RXN2_9APHY|nr:hypothetical protein GSI_12032 [Ganoderma sinense ZZ0214-1]